MRNNNYVGAPGKWAPKELPIRLQSDTGRFFIDQNAFRNPRYPLEALFRSAYALDPDFDPKAFDVVTDRNNLRKLLTMLSDTPIKDFRIDVELAGDTLLLTRWEPENTESFTGFRGFGHEFERQFTTFPPELRRSAGHHRIVTYSLGGLKILLRFTVDGYKGDYGRPRSDGVDDLNSLIGSLQISSEGGIEQSAKSALKVIRGGHKVPHDSLLELKTRTFYRRIQMPEVIYQLWFSQIQSLYVGYHNRGVFTELNQSNYKTNGAFDRFCRDKATILKRLIRLLEIVKRKMRSVDQKRAVLLYKGGSLKLYERSGDWHSLPEDLLAKWG